MSYDLPTYAQFIARFPVFNNLAKWPQETVELVIAEAGNNVDTSWLEQDYQNAIMYQTAHWLTTEATANAGAPTPSVETFLASESFAGMSRSYQKVSDGSISNSEMWGSTVYGRRYLDLLRKNKPSILVI